MKSEKVYIEYLLLQVEAGHADALNQLLLIVRSKMLTYAKRMLSGSGEADDCVQEAMVVICKQIKRLKNHQAFHGWVYKILHNRCLDYWRKANRHVTDSMENHDFVDETIEQHHTDQQCDINRAMADLAPEHQSVLVLFYFEGFKVAEIASILEKPAGTIKSLLFAAREQIKSFINPESNHEY